MVRRYIVIPINDAGGEDVNLKFRSIDDGEVCGWCQGVVCQHCLKERAVKDEAGRPQKDERGNVVKVLVSKGVNLRDYRGSPTARSPCLASSGTIWGPRSSWSRASST